MQARWAGKAREGSRDRFGKSQRCYSVVRPTGKSIAKDGRDGQGISVVASPSRHPEIGDQLGLPSNPW